MFIYNESDARVTGGAMLISGAGEKEQEKKRLFIRNVVVNSHSNWKTEICREHGPNKRFSPVSRQAKALYKRN